MSLWQKNRDTNKVRFILKSYTCGRNETVHFQFLCRKDISKYLFFCEANCSSSVCQKIIMILHLSRAVFTFCCWMITHVFILPHYAAFGILVPTPGSNVCPCSGSTVLTSGQPRKSSNCIAWPHHSFTYSLVDGHKRCFQVGLCLIALPWTFVCESYFYNLLILWVFVCIFCLFSGVETGWVNYPGQWKRFWLAPRFLRCFQDHLPLCAGILPGRERAELPSQLFVDVAK